MPKPKPDKIVRHELVLGRAEREMLDAAVMAIILQNGTKSVGNLVTPFTTASKEGIVLMLSALSVIGAYMKRDEAADLFIQLQKGKAGAVEWLIEQMNWELDEKLKDILSRDYSPI